MAALRENNKRLLNRHIYIYIFILQSASTYERTLTFIIKNDGSATFFFDWHYNSSAVKKYLQVWVEPRSGRVSSGAEVGCILHFNLKQVPVQAFPVTLNVSYFKYLCLINAITFIFQFGLTRAACLTFIGTAYGWTGARKLVL